MAFNGSKGIYRFEVSNSIPEMQSTVAADSRYSKPFDANEGIRILAPLESGLYQTRFDHGITASRGVYRGSSRRYTLETIPAAVPGNYWSQQWNFDSSIKKDHESPGMFAHGEYWYTSTQPEHRFLGESDGKLLITNAVRSYGSQWGSGFPQHPGFCKDIFAGHPDNTAGDFLLTPVPYLYGSVIEGVDSGARRFVVGPLFDFVSNSFVANGYIQLGDYGEIAASGTGPYRPNMRFIMPLSGVGLTDGYDKDRLNLFDYVAETTPKTGQPFNSKFLPKTPFSHENIDYSGFRIRGRKSLPVPYQIHDKDTRDAMINGTTAQPDVNFVGKNASLEYWKFPSYTTNTTRRHAFAITKRHVLGLNHPQHFAPFDDRSEIDLGGFREGLTGVVPFTDSAEYGKGDKIQFWDKQSRSIIERTIVDTQPVDAETIKNAINQITWVFPDLRSRWNCYECWLDGIGWAWCCNTQTNGYGTVYYTYNFNQVLNDYLPIGGNVCTSFITPEVKWKGGIVNSSDRVDGDNVGVLRTKLIYKNSFNQMFYGSLLTGLTGGFDLLPTEFGAVTDSHGDIHRTKSLSLLFPSYSSFYGPMDMTGGISGPTASANPDRYIPPYPAHLESPSHKDISIGYIRDRLVSPPPGTLGTSNQYDGLLPMAIDAAILDESFSNAAFSDRLSGVQGFASFSQGGPTQVEVAGTTDTDLDVEEPFGFGIAPPKDMDPTLPDNSIERAFYYLPKAARNAIRRYFPHGINNVFLGGFNQNDEWNRSITFQYLISHFKGLLATKAAVHLLDEDLPDGVRPIKFIDTRRSRLHKYEMFFDDHMRGMLTRNCPPKSRFRPYFAYGDPEISADGFGGYAIGSDAVAYTNPYGQNTIRLELAKVGRCQDTYDEHFLDECGENPGATSGPKCRWSCWSISIGSGGDVRPGPGIPADVMGLGNCYRCWNDPTSTKLPSGMQKADMLLEFGRLFNSNGWPASTNFPGPIFTYDETGTPILSKIMVGYGYQSADAAYQWLYEYTVTGHHGEPFQQNEPIYQNWNGTTGSSGQYGVPSAELTVMKHSVDVGRLTLSYPPSYGSRGIPGNMIYSDDHLLRCTETLGSTGWVGFGGGWTSLTAQCNNETKEYFPHDLGKTAYIWQGPPEAPTSWAHVTHGGPRLSGMFASFGLWGDGFIGMSSLPTYAPNDNCEEVEYIGWSEIDKKSKTLKPNQVPGVRNVLTYATYNIGTFLSDQKIYYQSPPETLVPGQTPYYYFGEVKDIFMKVLSNLNMRNGVTGTYEPQTKVLTYDPNRSDFEQPMPSSLEYLPPRVVYTSPGVYIDEQEFLK